jgi:3-isopropylmalate/(R)-2-methylmalate dehydratase large subunit
MTIVCGDSHTSTHGAFGALAFGIGTRRWATCWRRNASCRKSPRPMRIRVDGNWAGVTAKDIILAIIARNGVGGGDGLRLRVHGAAPSASPDAWPTV